MDYLCYLLQSSNKKRTYVGITNNLTRRIRQHNGEISGGAKSTSTDRPWSIIVTVAGFQCINHALMFEWAMHHMKHIGNGIRHIHIGVIVPIEHIEQNVGNGVVKRFAQLQHLLCKSNWTRRAPLANTVPLTITFTSNETMSQFFSQLGTKQLGTHIIIKSSSPRIIVPS